MNSLDKITALKKKATTLQREADKAKGAMESLEKEMQQKFSCSSIKDARKMLRRSKIEQQEMEERLKKELHRFEEQYGDLLQ